MEGMKPCITVLRLHNKHERCVIIHSLIHAFQSADQVHCSRRSMAALQPCPVLGFLPPCK